VRCCKSVTVPVSSVRSHLICTGLPHVPILILLCYFFFHHHPLVFAARVRLVVIDWAVRIFPFSNVRARYLCLRLVGENGAHVPVELIPSCSRILTFPAFRVCVRLGRRSASGGARGRQEGP
jgi:hypothetical protein